MYMRIVGTRLHAGLAADAAVGIEIDNAVLAPVHGCDRTDGDARRLLAMIAARHLKNAASVGKRALLHVLHPGPVDAEGDLIFGFARDRAGMAADALAIIDYESVFHVWNFNPRSVRP